MILVELDNKSTSVRMKAAKHPVSEELMVGPGENLFNFMADRLRDFMLEHNLLGEEKEHHLGFTFSFPTVQHSLASADLANWTKGQQCVLSSPNFLSMNNIESHLVLVAKIYSKILEP